MFLYLSKLLPLFVYPAGLAVILIVLSIVTRRRTSLSIGLSVAAALVLLVFGNGWVAGRLTRSLEWRHVPYGELPEADAIVLLGGATRAAIYPRAMTEVNEAGDRMIQAAKLYRDGKAPLIVASGGAIDWMGSATPEAEGMREILVFLGIAPEAIVVESSARNTYENALRVREIADELGIERILLVTSALHMPRSVGIFEQQRFVVIPAPTDFQATLDDGGAAAASLGARFYGLFPDVEYLTLSTRALKEYLGIAVYRLRGWM
jgi:uncharacterized SAM-binding protein YcdF (DUF218 family)